jgi:YidC/Oxa1 family membrane protein insertase
MDRNSIIGLVLITAIIIGYMVWQTPSAEERALIKRQQDSLALVQKADSLKKLEQQKKDTLVLGSATDSTLTDSARVAIRKQQFGIFSKANEGKAEDIVLENELIKVHVSTKGGRITSVELKNYKNYESYKNKENKPLELFNADSSFQFLEFRSGNRVYRTDEMYFTPSGTSFAITGDAQKQLVMRLSTDDPGKYIEYVYSLAGNSYMLGYKINSVGMQDVIPVSEKFMTLHWGMSTPSHEKNMLNQREVATIFFRFLNGDTDYLAERSDETKVFETKDPKLQWISFKQQYFSTVLVADKEFEKPTALQTHTPEGSVNYVRNMRAELLIPYGHQATESFGMKVYFGPNHYNTLKQYDIELEEQINLGWGIFGWVNKGLVIPVFNWLNSFDLSFGIIILILTIIIKIILFPVAYKMYISSAKMRILKPEIDELNKKFEKEDPMKKQQALMGLYKQAGVSPMAGCVPLLLQLPILIALVSFFPSSIELRQEHFMWAEDLSTYDSPINLGFEIPFLGSHLSMFAILMTISTIIYTWYNSQLMGSTNQMPGMKFMMYFMPILFLGFLNSRSSGLSYYYLLANIISIAQAILMQRFVDQKALHAKIEEHKKKPVTASKWQQRMEALVKQQQAKQQSKQLKKGDDKGKKK